MEKYLQEIAEDDFLIYADAGCTINKHGKAKFQEYLEMLKNSDYGFLSFAIPVKENQWTVKELFQYFDLNCEDSEINRNQYMATVLVVRKTRQSLKIMDEVMKVLHQDPYAITDDYNHHQKKDFKENRYDQSFLSLARKKHGSIVIDDETEVIPVGYLRKIIDYYIGRKSRSQYKPTTIYRKVAYHDFPRLFRSIIETIYILTAKLFRRKYPFWATRIRK